MDTQSLETMMDEIFIEQGGNMDFNKQVFRNLYNEERELTYEVGLSSGRKLKSSFFFESDNTELVPYFSTVIDLGKLGSAKRRTALLYSMTRQNYSITDPFRLSLNDQRHVCVCLHLRADAVDVGYLRYLVSMMIFFSEKYLSVICEKYGFLSKNRDEVFQIARVKH